jgi:tripartite-type tricarboxylate transporter receptor subunit TctC
MEFLGVLARAAGILAAALVPALAQAQAYPAKPVRIIIPFPPGGGAEGAARLVGNHLSQALGQPFVVEPRPGGNTLIGTEAVAKSAPDGYTLLMTGNSTMSIQPFVFQGRLPYDPLGDFAPVGMVSKFPFFLFVPANLPAANLKELAALSKAKPGTLSYASNGSGTITHLATEMLKLGLGMDGVHVPYKGFGPALPDLLSGRVSMMLADIAPVGEHLRAGKLRVLGATSAQRSAFLPDVPTIAEQGVPGYDIEIWFGLYAPGKTPAEIVSRLSGELQKYLASPEAKEAYGKLGHEAAPATPAQVRDRIVAEHKRFSAAVKEANLKPE